MRIVFTVIFLLATHLSVNAQLPDSVQGAELYEQGMQIYQSGNYADAIPVFTESLKKFTLESPKAYSQTLVRIGIVYSFIPNFDSALFYFRKAEPIARQVAEEDQDYFVIINQQMQLAFTLYQLRKFEEALPIFNETERLILKDSTNYYLLAYINGSKGRMCVKAGDFDKGEVYLNKALEYARLSKRTGAIAQALNVYSSYHLENGSLNKAKELNEEIIRIEGEENGYDNLSMAIIYGLQGRIEMEFQEYERALNWMNRALKIHELSPNKSIEKYGYNLYNLGLAQSNMGDYEHAISSLDEALKKYKQVKVEPVFTVPIVAEKAKALTLLGKLDEAQKLFEEINPLIASAELTVLIRTNALLAKAIFLRKSNQIDEARNTYLEVIDILSKDFSNKNSPLANTYYDFSILESEQGNLEQSLFYIEEAISNNKTMGVGPESSRIISGNNHVSYLMQKVDILEKKHNGDPFTGLTNAFGIVEEAISFVQDYRKRSVGSNFSADAIEKVRKRALNIGFQLFEYSNDAKIYNKMFQFSELSKSQQLSEWLAIASETGVFNISKEKIVSQKKLASEMKLYQSFLQAENSTAEPNDGKIQRYSDSLTSISERYFQHISHLKSESPSFFKTLYETIMPSVEDVAKILEVDEQLVSFNITDEFVYVFVIGRDNQVFKLDVKADEVNQLVTSFRSAIIDVNNDGFEEVSKELYQRIILPIIPHLIAENINVINDGALSYLPFELLISDNTKNESAYLCENYNIRYSYSAGVLSNKKGDRKNNISSMLAFAPQFKALPSAQVDVIRNELSALPGSFEEVKTVSAFLNGEALLGKSATETTFKEKADDYNFIHLATHAIVNEVHPERSKLVFDIQSDTLNDGYLHAYEIYNLDLNAQLVTLSACNTGFGKIKKGEGVMSLSRAFAYAGVPAAVMSLWPASDKSTPELMKYFYQNLKDGQTKDVALNNARKQYLATATGKARHPFYWGGFVLIGDNSAIEDDKNLLVYLIPSMLVIVMILTVYRRKKNRHRATNDTI
ncbi:MAG: CHAT domain-containing protein [Ekhidna sp.]